MFHGPAAMLGPRRILSTMAEVCECFTARPDAGAKTLPVQMHHGPAAKLGHRAFLSIIMVLGHEFLDVLPSTAQQLFRSQSASR
jgi:hypothetical protein